MDSRFEKFLKPSKAKPKTKKAKKSKAKDSEENDSPLLDLDLDLDSDLTKDSNKINQNRHDINTMIETNFDPSTQTSNMETTLLAEQIPSMYAAYQDNGSKKWLEQDNPIARSTFNVINQSLHPDRPAARGVAVLAAKGTTFDDKRSHCLSITQRLRRGETSGEITLVPDPENPFDSNAVGIVEVETGNLIGYIPKANEVNKTYAEALKEGKFCGGYVIEAKASRFKGEDSAVIFVATGWL